MKKLLLPILLALAAASCAGNVSVKDFGAVGDGVALDTEAIQAAIDRAAEKGGGVVRVPEGTYLCGSIWLKSNVELHLEAGAVIKGSPDIKDIELADSPYWSCFILNCDNVSIDNCYVHTRRKDYHTFNGDGIDIDRSVREHRPEECGCAGGV